MAIDRLAHPAVVVVDMQNDFVRVGAPLEVPESRPTIVVHQALLGACRERGIPIIYTKFVAGPERTLIWEWSPMLAPPVCCCWKGFLRLTRTSARSGLRDIIDEIYLAGIPSSTSSLRRFPQHHLDDS
jgi:nicotinamidase-related amidase